MEEWRDVKGYPYVQVSSEGRLRVLAHTVTKVTRKKLTNVSIPERYPAPLLGRNKKYTICQVPDLREHNKIRFGKRGQRSVTIHRAVCRAFHGEPTKEKPNACHRNDNPFDNRKDNLYWGSYEDNESDKRRNGNLPTRARHHATPLTEEDVAYIKRVYRPKTRRPELREFTSNGLAEKFGVHRTTIENIVSGRTWSG